MNQKHNSDLYNTLLTLSRSIFFYKNIKLSDNFDTRIHLMFFHFSIMMIVSKKRGSKFDQIEYDNFFHNIENNLRELGFGDVSVNKKMKDLNKVLYDILLKIEVKNEKKFMLNHQLILTYFNDLNDQKSNEYLEFNSYFVDFFNFCYELSLDNMVEDAINFRK